MKRTLLTMFMSLQCCVHGAQKFDRLDWAKVGGADAPLGGEVTNEAGRSALRVQNTNDFPLQVRLWTVEKPSITGSYYAVRGEIKYSRVEGDGYLEMWNVFPPRVDGGADERYFSRTYGESGEMGKIRGSSGWRGFLLPFHTTGARGSPSALEVNLILPGRGTVFVGPLELVEYPSGAFSFGGLAHAWWSDRTGGLIGGILGAAFGCMASLVAWLASKGRARGFVLGASWAIIAGGVILLIAAVAALTARQPYGVWFPLLLCGMLIVIILPARLRMFQKLYQEHELRRMEAADAI